MPAARLESHRVTPLPLPGATVDRTAGNRTIGGQSGGKATRGFATPPAPTYFAGPENSLVVAGVGRLIAAAHGNPHAGTLTLFGPPGCGKSLLASGVAAAWIDAHGDEAVLALTGLELRRQLERAFAAERKRPGYVGEFADSLAAVRLLVVEDLEGLAESPSAVEMLTTTLDRLHDAGGAVLVTAARPLGEVAGLDARIVGRLAAGLMLEVAAPAAEARRELLVASLSAIGGRIEPAAAADLAAWLAADARRVLTVATQLQARFGARKPISRSDARVFVADAARELTTTPLSDIATVVARYYTMPLKTLRSSSRKAPVVLARAVTIYLARQLTPLSYEELGRYLGGRDHTTVMHNYNRIAEALPKERALRSAIDDLLRKLGRADLTAAPAGHTGATQ